MLFGEFTDLSNVTDVKINLTNRRRNIAINSRVYEKAERNLNIPWDFSEQNSGNNKSDGNIINNGTVIKVTYAIYISNKLKNIKKPR
ncbi:hypothetical protein [Clostridium sp.]|uniref:hypothetical protein n=1 Tax=Clostridium sp. TaxID=1506 RepID=UPI003D6C84C6